MGMNPLLHGLEPVDVLRPFRSKGIQHRLVFSCRMDPPFDTVTSDQVLKTETGRDDTDAAGNRTVVDPDIIRRSRQPISPRSGDIFHESVNRQADFIRKSTDLRSDQCGLYGRSTG